MSYFCLPACRTHGFTKENIRRIRPGDGMAPKYYATVMGKTASQDIQRGTPISWDMMPDKQYPGKLFVIYSALAQSAFSATPNKCGGILAWRKISPSGRNDSV